MQTVSSEFATAVAAPITRPEPGCLISWLKGYNASATFFQLDHSHLDSGDFLKGNSDVVGFFDLYDYQNETANLLSYKITKKISARPWGVIMAHATVVLDNTSKRYLPGYDGTIGDYILRDRPIKLSVGYNGEYINQFVGFTERPKNTLVSRNTTIECYDAMTYLSNKKSNLSAFVNTSFKDIVEALLNEQGFSPDQYSIEESTQPNIGYLMPKDRIVTDIFAEGCEAEGGIMFVDENGIIRFWNRLHFAKNQTSRWAFTYSNMKDIQWDSTNVINDVQITAKPLKPAAFNKIFELSQATDDTLVPAGSSIDYFAEFKDDLGNFPAISVDTPVYVASNAGSSTYSTNYNKDGSGETGNTNITLSSVYNFGSKYRLTFTNAGALPVYITNIQLFGQPARVTQLNTAPQIDATSIGLYGLNPDDNGTELEIKNDMIQDVNSANAIGYMLLRLFGNPMARMQLPNFPVPHLQLGDAVTATILDTSTDVHAYIMGSEIEFSVGSKLTSTLYVEERPLTSYFQLDISYLDGSDKLAL